MFILRVFITILDILLILLGLNGATGKSKTEAVGALAIEVVWICNIILIWNVL